ncbi:MAG TPA: DUF1080 domain-containing protein [Thermoguttaceae bacterium]|nr:DUF1080 domain-containing protein [Thermoguttaceae bacterium]
MRRAWIWWVVGVVMASWQMSGASVCALDDVPLEVGQDGQRERGDGLGDCSASEGKEEGFTPLFDGKTFDGWEGNLQIFRIEEGAIVGGRLKERVLRSELLCTRREYGDFELRLEFKLLGQGANAGVQIRSQRIPQHHEMIGYQADLGEGYWGCLYDESRRKKVLDGPPPEQRNQLVRPNQWNEYRIRCQGRRIQLWINGRQTVDYTEPDETIPQRGVIGLQIHGGPPSEAWYRNIRIQELPATQP